MLLKCTNGGLTGEYMAKKNKAFEALSTIKQDNKSGFYESLTPEQREILHDLADIWKENPEEIKTRTWQRVTNTFGPLLGRPRLAVSTFKRAVMELADGKLKRK